MLIADHNTSQHASSRQIVAGCPGECKKLILRPFPAGILTLKTVIQTAPELIFIQKIEKIFWEAPQREGDTPSAHTPLGAYSALTNPRYATVWTILFLFSLMKMTLLLDIYQN